MFAHTRRQQAVWSLDGREVEFVVGFETGAEVGGFVTITTPDVRRLVRAAHDGFDTGELVTSTDAEVPAVVDGGLGCSVGIHVGRLRRAAVDAVFKASGFSRHTFLCGQSGSDTTSSQVPKGMIAESPAFQLGEMQAAGPVAPTPMRLRMGERWTPEGGADLPTTWARP